MRHSITIHLDSTPDGKRVIVQAQGLPRLELDATGIDRLRIHATRLARAAIELGAARLIQQGHKR